jgi:TonB-linked SusC/RagA family outer membrane protein
MSVYAQDRTVSGKVTSKDDGTPLPGVTVMVKGTTVGTQTDVEGTYKISVPAEGKVLVFSFVGMRTQEVEIGSQSTVNLAMSAATEELETVVVTALGFKEDRDKLGSSMSKIKTADVTRSGEAGLINGLAGKAAGVTIVRSSGDPGAGSYIQIRGQSTITGNLQPLTVIDGIPISNSNFGDGVAGVTQQSRMNDLNPEDIESVQILKGASAAALWGSRAANGVIVITTKKGKGNNKINVSFKSSVSIDQFNQRTPLQSNYGAGRNGTYANNPPGGWTWGDKIADRSGGADDVNMNGAVFVGDNGQKFYPITKKNSKATYVDSNWDQVFGTGYFMDNNLSISGADNSGGSFFLSASDLNQKGIIKNNSDYRRGSVRLNVEKKFGDKVRVSANANYINIFSNRTQKGSNTAGLMLGLLRTPADFDNSVHSGTYYPQGENGIAVLNAQRSYRNYLGANVNPIYNNPGWTINKQPNTSEVERFIGSTELGVKPVQWLELVGRFGIDTYKDRQTAYFPVRSASFPTGRGSIENIGETQLNMDLIARFNKDFGTDFSVNGLIGFNYNNILTDDIGAVYNNFIIADAPLNFDNATALNKTPFNGVSTVRSNAGYVTLGVAYKNMLFFNATGRAETASTFGPKSDKVFYYPSADIAWQFSQLEALKNSTILSFGKLRASYGSVGVRPAPYRTRTYYASASFTDGWGSTLDAGVYGSGSYILNSIAGNPAVRPERKTEMEIGTDLRFLGDRLRFSATYYQNQTVDALFNVAVPASTGFTNQYKNAATLENKGLELEIGADVVRKGDFKWAIDVNWNMNRNKVTDLQGTESLFLAGFEGSSSRAVLNQPVGVLWGGKWARDESGKLILDANGFPTAADKEGVIGDPNPNWRGGVVNTFSWKNLSLSFVVETMQGGQMWSGTRGVLYNFGTHADVGNEQTAPTNIKDYTGKVIPAGTKFRGNIQDFGAGPVALTQPWYTSLGGGFGPVSEQFVYDASWTRLRELTIAYTLRSEGFRKLTKLQSVEFSATGRNLMVWTPFVGIDPETNLTGASNGRGLEYFNNPSTRSYLFTLRINY